MNASDISPKSVKYTSATCDKCGGLFTCLGEINTQECPDCKIESLTFYESLGAAIEKINKNKEQSK